MTRVGKYCIMWQRGRVHGGIGWWKNSAKLFAFGRDYRVDSITLGVRIGPFWLCVER
jgi:hypothetical protein